LTAKYKIKTFPPKKNDHVLRAVMEHQGLKSPGIYCVPDKHGKGMWDRWAEDSMRHLWPAREACHDRAYYEYGASYTIQQFKQTRQSNNL
jgi:hypothetical protein